MQSSSTVQKSVHKLPPLRESATPLASKLAADGSTPSSPDIATLLKRFDEPLRDAAPSTPVKPAIAALGPHLTRPQREGNGEAQSAAPKPPIAPITTRKSRLPLKGLIAALAIIALVPLGILFAQLWPDMMRPEADSGPEPAAALNAAETPRPAGLAQPKQDRRPLEVALSSPPTIAANAGEVVPFPVVIDATAALPARSIVTITALPEGASFSEGRPYGATGWSLRPDEIGLLRLRLPAQSGASDVHLELVAGDGTVLSQSETRVSIAPAPPAVATTDDPGTAFTDTAASEQVAQAEPAKPVAESAPPPQQKPSASTGDDSSPKVNTVKVVTVEPPRETRPHDGAYALGSASEEPQTPTEWMETKTAVDMHTKAQQSSATVKVAQGGIKVRVTGRDKNWVQVTDPASSTTGWIYNRFLKPAEPPAQ